MNERTNERRNERANERASERASERAPTHRRQFFRGRMTRAPIARFTYAVRLFIAAISSSFVARLHICQTRNGPSVLGLIHLCEIPGKEHRSSAFMPISRNVDDFTVSFTDFRNSRVRARGNADITSSFPGREKATFVINPSTYRYCSVHARYAINKLKHVALHVAALTQRNKANQRIPRRESTGSRTSTRHLSKVRHKMRESDDSRCVGQYVNKDTWKFSSRRNRRSLQKKLTREREREADDTKFAGRKRKRKPAATHKEEKETRRTIGGRGGGGKGTNARARTTSRRAHCIPCILRRFDSARATDCPRIELEYYRSSCSHFSRHDGLLSGFTRAFRSTRSPERRESLGRI